MAKIDELREVATKKARELDGHRIAAGIYGTLMGVVAISAVDGKTEVSPLNVAIILVMSAVAIWVAHSYAELFSKRIKSGKRINTAILRATLASAGPIVFVNLFLLAPLLLVTFKIVSMHTALNLAKGVGVAMLAAIGVVAGNVTNETPARKVMLVLLTGGSGVAVLLLKELTHALSYLISH